MMMTEFGDPPKDKRGHRCGTSGHYEWLRRKRKRRNRTDLQVACGMGDLEYVEKNLDELHGLIKCLKLACENSRFEVMEFLLKYHRLENRFKTRTEVDEADLDHEVIEKPTGRILEEINMLFRYACAYGDIEILELSKVWSRCKYQRSLCRSLSFRSEHIR